MPCHPVSGWHGVAGDWRAAKRTRFVVALAAPRPHRLLARRGVGQGYLLHLILFPDWPAAALGHRPLLPRRPASGPPKKDRSGLAALTDSARCLRLALGGDSRVVQVVVAAAREECGRTLRVRCRRC